MLDELDFVDGTVEYHDEPIEGYLRHPDGRLFAFRRVHVIPHHLIHWILLPSEDATTPVGDIFKRSARAPIAWISILEDRRTPTPAEYGAVMNSKVPQTWD